LKNKGFKSLNKNVANQAQDC
jgi:hypothetical protein